MASSDDETSVSSSPDAGPTDTTGSGASSSPDQSSSDPSSNSSSQSGIPTDGGSTDSSSTDSSSTDSSSTDSSSTDSSSTDSSSSAPNATDSSNSSATDAGSSAAGSTDGGSSTAAGSNGASAANAGSPAPNTGSAATPIDYKAIVAIPAGINNGLTFASQATMLSAFGNPGPPDPNCGTSSATLAPLMKTANVGPFKVTGFGPAVDALTRVFAAVQSSLPDLYALLGTQGMLCVRYVRGSTTNYSNHAWGTAIDLTIGGILTARGSTTVTQGLLSLCPFMAAEQFFWGAGFSPTPDGMHYEASNELITAWKANGTIP